MGKPFQDAPVGFRVQSFVVDALAGEGAGVGEFDVEEAPEVPDGVGGVDDADSR